MSAVHVSSFVCNVETDLSCTCASETTWRMTTLALSMLTFFGSDWYTNDSLVVSTARSRLDKVHGHVKFSHTTVWSPDLHAMGSSRVSYSMLRPLVMAPPRHVHACSVRLAMVSDSRTRFGHAPQTVSAVAVQGESWHWVAGHWEHLLAFPCWQYELLGHRSHLRFEVGVHGVTSKVPWAQGGVQFAFDAFPRQKVLGEHAEHTLFVTLVQGVDSNVPGAQAGAHGNFADAQ
jgi:hypothetical protein